MRKTWQFKVGLHTIKITNSWLFGTKLYVNGELKDIEHSLFAVGDKVLLSAPLNQDTLEIVPRAFFTLDIDAFLATSHSRELVFSTSKHIPIKVSVYQAKQH